MLLRATVVPVILLPLAIFVQLFLGGAYLVSDAGYPSIGGMDTVHPVFGLVVGIIALAALIVVWFSKPRARLLAYTTTVTFVLVVLAGLAADKSTMLGHDTFATLAFGASIVGAVAASGWRAAPTAAVSQT